MSQPSGVYAAKDHQEGEGIGVPLPATPRAGFYAGLSEVGITAISQYLPMVCVTNGDSWRGDFADVPAGYHVCGADAVYVSNMAGVRVSSEA